MQGDEADSPPDAEDSGERIAEDRRPTDPSSSSARRPKTQVDRSPRKKKRDDKDKVDEHVGKIFGGKYRIERLVAKGGMGRVYRAIQFPLERPVAIKILNAEFQRTDPQFVRRFFLEASTAAKLAHPHSITVFDYGEAESGELFIAMEFLKGRPLSKVIQTEAPFPADRALKIGVQICRALREAHAMGIIHRDLKPGNVFLVEEGDEEGDYAKVLDFGLVKLFRPENPDGKNDEVGILGEGDPELTRTGTLLGSPKYMSPEQIQGHSLDPRTDIYSFGVILFQMMTGKAPFTGATGVDVIYKHVHQAVPALREMVEGLECPVVVEAIIQRCLKKKRDERYASMDDLITALKEAARMVGGKIVSVDSVAEVSSSLAKAAKEAGFAPPVLEDPTPTGQVAERSGRVTQAPRSSATIPLAVSGLGFLVALGTLMWVMFIGPALSSKPEEEKKELVAVAPPVRLDREVSIHSSPSGAQVFEGGRALGVTPLKKVFSVLRVGEERRELTFRLDGFKDQAKAVAFDAQLAAVEITLEAIEQPLAAEDEEETTDRKRAPSKKHRTSASDSTKSEKDKDDDSTPYRRNPY